MVISLNILQTNATPTKLRAPTIYTSTTAYKWTLGRAMFLHCGFLMHNGVFIKTLVAYVVTYIVDFITNVWQDTRGPIGSDTILWTWSADRIPRTLITIGSSDREQNTKPNISLPIESWYKSFIGIFRSKITRSQLNEKRQTGDIYSWCHNGRRGNVICVCSETPRGSISLKT